MKEINDEFAGFTKAFVTEEVPTEPTAPKEPEPATELVQEEPTPEPVTETVTEPTETVTEPPVTETTTDSAPEKIDPISSLNEMLKTDFKSGEDIKMLIETASKAKQLEEQLNTLNADIDFYKENADPLKHFASEDDYRLQQFKKANPDKSSSVADRLFSSDLSKLSDLEVLAQYEMFNNDVEGGEAGAKELVEQQYGLDPETEPKDWSTLTRNQLKKAANFVRQEIKETKESFKLPEKIDLEGKRKSEQEALATRTESITKAWEEVIPKVLTEINEIEITTLDKDGKSESLMKYAIDDESKKELGEEAKNILIANNQDVNAESGKFVDRYIKDQYLLRNIDKIIKLTRQEAIDLVDKAKDEETHNAAPITTEVKPTNEDDAKKQDLIDYALGGTGWKSNKPF